MILLIESIVLCLLFTVMVYIMSREPIKTLYNYPPKIQERVKSLEEYKNKIPTQKNKVFAKSYKRNNFSIRRNFPRNAYDGSIYGYCLGICRAYWR